MKITLDAAMRARDVSRPRAGHEPQPADGGRDTGRAARRAPGIVGAENPTQAGVSGQAGLTPTGPGGQAWPLPEAGGAPGGRGKKRRPRRR